MMNNYFYKKPLSNIYKKPSNASEITSQIIYGEKFNIISKNNNWLKIITSFDNYIGYIKNENYIRNFEPTHKVFVLKASIYDKVRKKTKYFLTFASKILIIQEDKKFIEFEKNKWIKKSNIKKINHIEKNYIKIFKLFLNTKYFWGGKTYKGIDCSAILQVIFFYNNKFYPRDTKDQVKYSKKNISKDTFKKGDIIFWKGHVAICINSKKLIHAFGPKKMVIIMSIKKTISEIKKNSKLNVIKKMNINDLTRRI
ncbi:Cell wall-associated hydrolases (invasion-associated proteins) [Candidatus Pelagibacter ubique]|uniref:Cell wall-associated hydrolases (Invasion-associated proteins) n=1 Tax=Pelagibacter ubique TaxID=198252 RepID=A0ABX1T2F2_PELUQ|nr:NlpC/P60 family protein [Candidatus Pelagibacter ubique]NMN67415.1 Cell wall-associated hydrolases (invasion-associated proteins) [Candidatus Pelagibacter ubique]